jgi:hypothetical protein
MGEKTHGGKGDRKRSQTKEQLRKFNQNYDRIFNKKANGSGTNGKESNG